MKRLLAVLLIIMSGFAVGQAAKTQQVHRPSKGQHTEQENPGSGHVGRYQIFFSPHARADVYLVDTETGKIWKPVTITNATDPYLGSAPEIWVYQDRIDNAQEFSAWLALHQSTPKAP